MTVNLLIYNNTESSCLIFEIVRAIYKYLFIYFYNKMGLVPKYRVKYGCTQEKY